MLELHVKLGEMFDEAKNEFVDPIEVTLELEHSLVSLSKWESKFKKPFLSKEDKTSEQLLWYIQAMNRTPDVPPEVFSRLGPAEINAINTYINDPMTAAWFADVPGAKKNTEVITSELLYFWMISFQIPITCENWHLNRLLTLIRTCNVKNAKPKKVSRAQAAAEQRALNEQRLKQYETTG